MRRPIWLIAAVVLLGLWAWSQRADHRVLEAPTAPTATGAVVPARGAASLPAEAHDVLQRIARGGPFEYRQDGGMFQNREHRLPPQPRGYYREYTVATPGARDRGPRRIVTGGDPPVEDWYTADHYRSFRRFEIHQERAR